MKENKTKNIVITTFLILVILLLLYGLMNAFVGGVVGKENYHINLIKRSLQAQINEDVEYVNRFDLNQSGYVFKTNNTYYFINQDNEYLDMLAIDKINLQDFKKLSNQEANIYLAYYDQPVVVLENSSFVDVYDLKSNNIFKYYK